MRGHNNYGIGPRWLAACGRRRRRRGATKFGPLSPLEIRSLTIHKARTARGAANFPLFPSSNVRFCGAFFFFFFSASRRQQEEEQISLANAAAGEK